MWKYFWENNYKFAGWAVKTFLEYTLEVCSLANPKKIIICHCSVQIAFYFLLRKPHCNFYNLRNTSCLFFPRPSSYLFNRCKTTSIRWVDLYWFFKNLSLNPAKGLKLAFYTPYNTQIIWPECHHNNIENTFFVVCRDYKGISLAK